MKLLLALILSVISFAAQATVNIFACEPEWAALAQAVGGDKVNTFAATHAKQDPHYIRARPSLIAMVNKADILFCSGGGLEAGWLPILLQKATAAVQPGTAGYLMASEIVPVLEKPTNIDRSLGDVHPDGNPHVHLNPHNILLIAAELSKRLAIIDKANAAFYQNQWQSFNKNWTAAIQRWEASAADLTGKTVVVHHKSFSYLLDWLNLKAVATLEPKPGIPPTTSHLEKLLQQLQAKPAAVIIRTPYDPKEASEWLAEKTGISAQVLPYTVGGDDASTDLWQLFERSINLLQNAIGTTDGQ